MQICPKTRISNISKTITFIEKLHAFEVFRTLKSATTEFLKNFIFMINSIFEISGNISKTTTVIQKLYSFKSDQNVKIYTNLYESTVNTIFEKSGNISKTIYSLLKKCIH